jgi:hypothetical protein
MGLHISDSAEISISAKGYKEKRLQMKCGLGPEEEAVTLEQVP